MVVVSLCAVLVAVFEAVTLAIHLKDVDVMGQTIQKRTELNIAERRKIEDLLHRKVNVTEIARQINRHRATVYREIKRNFFKDDELPELNGYYGMLAQKSAGERRARRRKLVRMPELRDAVIDRLQEGWSPEQIAGRLKFEGHATTVSHETIYSYVYSPDGQS